uniref:Uncharacterized protein n=1 Tax=Amphimedon queenslandica TaxID=400682 RepID=A0A1X7VYS0_AMPQE
MSMLMYASHLPKQLFQRFEKVGICVSHKTIICMIDKLTTDFYQPVKEWSSKISRCLWQDKDIIPENQSSVSQVDTDVEISQARDELEGNTIPSLSQASEMELAVDDITDSELTSPSVSSVSTPNYSGLSASEASSVSTEIVTVPPPTSQVAYSFKIVGDNLDKYVKHRHETVDCHSLSLHYFHSYFFLDKCSTEGLADLPSLPDITSNDFSSADILPTQADDNILIENGTIIYARIIQKYMPFFKKNIPRVIRHITHPYSSQMSQESVVVNLE